MRHGPTCSAETKLATPIHLDLGKKQQSSNLLLAGIYLERIGQLFSEEGAIQAMPALSQKFVWLLAASPGTYLASKAAPHTRDA
jgi:hypothetical protein